jgi:hypothetical protein
MTASDLIVMATAGDIERTEDMKRELVYTSSLKLIVNGLQIRNTKV